MNSGWMLALLTSATTMGIKSVGALLPPNAHTGRLGHALRRITPLLVPAVLTALIIEQVFSSHHRVVVDTRSVGLLAAVVAVKFRAPPALVLLLAAVITALGRLLFGHLTLIV